MTYVSIFANAASLLSYEGAQAVLVIAFASLARLASRHPIEVGAGD